MEGFKQCPECQCTDVPINAEICPFCGYSFGKQQKAGTTGRQNQPEKEPAVGQSQPKTASAVGQNQPKPEPEVARKRSEARPAVKRKEPVAPVADKGGSGGNKTPAAPPSPGYTTYRKKDKKKHGFLKFLIVVAVLAFVWFKFLKPSGEEDGDSRSRGMTDSYSTSSEGTDFESIEPDSQMADLEDDWMYGNEEAPELHSEEMPLDGAEDIPQFILPLSDQVYLTREDIEGLSAEELRIARNEIYARHGRIFKDEGLQAYFNSCDWYVGTVPADDFSDSVFNEYEKANKDLIVSYEHELGVNGQ